MLMLSLMQLDCRCRFQCRFQWHRCASCLDKCSRCGGPAGGGEGPLQESERDVNERLSKARRNDDVDRRCNREKLVRLIDLRLPCCSCCCCCCFSGSCNCKSSCCSSMSMVLLVSLEAQDIKSRRAAARPRPAVTDDEYESVDELFASSSSPAWPGRLPRPA